MAPLHQMLIQNKAGRYNCRLYSCCTSNVSASSSGVLPGEPVQFLYANHIIWVLGSSVESLQDCGSYMKLAIPRMLSEDELAAQHAVIMVAFITYMFPLGIQAAACARVGNALGAGDTDRALLTSKMSLTLAGGIAVVEGLVLGSIKTVIGFIFTSDEKIISLVSQLMNAYCFLQFFDGLVCVCTGICSASSPTTYSPPGGNQLTAQLLSSPECPKL